jgi:hypothetical protein
VAGAVVGAELSVGLAHGEHVPCGDDHAVDDRHAALFGPRRVARRCYWATR